MGRNFWMGELVRLRALTEEDADSGYFSVGPDFDSESERLGDSISIPVNPAQMAQAVIQMAQSEPEGDNIWLAIEDAAGELVGVINTHDCNRRMRNFRYGVDIAAAYRGNGYGREAVRLLLKYFFGELGYHKCTVGVYAFNERSVTFHEKFGFRREGRLRDMVFTGGRYYDELCFGMTDRAFYKLYGDSV